MAEQITLQRVVELALINKHQLEAQARAELIVEVAIQYLNKAYMKGLADASGISYATISFEMMKQEK